VIDLHCHVLPGIDDGPADLTGSLEMARRHVAAGVGTVVATPHVSWDHPNGPELIARRTTELNAALEREGLPLTVLPGAEVALTRAVEMSAQELQALRLGGGPWLLLEAPMAVDAPGIEGMVGIVQSRGVRVLLAHPERCACFHGDPEMLGRLVAGGCTAQVTAGALQGFFGRTVLAAARRYVEQGLVHVVASDAHDHERRAPGLAAAVDDAGYGPLTAWLTDEAPRAILDGAPLPPRPPFEPPAPPKRRFWRRNR